MSIRTWKRIITLVVLITIISLSIGVIHMSRLYNKFVLGNEDIIEYLSLSKDSGITLDEIITGLSYASLMESAYGGEALSYINEYPELYVDNEYEYIQEYNKKVYLTFDDGPTPGVTEKVLDILKRYDAKATFFVIYREGTIYEELYRRIVDEGHTIAVHSASHNYEKIYSSTESYLQDFATIANHIYSITGVKPEIFRFPGGSINSYNGAVYIQIIAEMTRRGYTYYDWNVASGDASYSVASTQWIINNVVNDVRPKQANIVLMHDSAGKKTTVEALPHIIEVLANKGYSFLALSNNVIPAQFGYLE